MKTDEAAGHPARDGSAAAASQLMHMSLGVIVGEPMFKPRLPESQIPVWAQKYSYTENDGGLIRDVRPAVLSRGYLERQEFLEICRWKTRRSQSRCAKNNHHRIRKLTSAAFATSDESLKMDLLRQLDGVEWPTASTLLHFCDKMPYPILDVRALWSLGYATPPRYTMDFWLSYLAYTRSLAERLNVPIRTVDRGLWQYSKARQRRLPK